MAENTEALLAYVTRLRRLRTTHGSPSAAEIADRTRGEAFAMSARQVEECLQGKAFPESGMEIHFLLRGITNGYGPAWSYSPEDGETESEVGRVIQLWREGTDTSEGPPTVPFTALPQHLTEVREAFSGDPAAVDTEPPPHHQPAPPSLPQPNTVDRTVNHLAGGIQQGAVVQAGAIGGDVTINVAPDPLAIHPMPVIVTIRFTDGTARHRERSAPDGFHIPADNLSVLVEGRSARAVILHALRVVVQARRPVIRQPYVDRGWYPMIMRTRCFNLNLSSEKPILSPLHGQPDFPFTVSATDPELFEIDPGVYEHEVDFRLALDWSCAGQNDTVLLPETGMFRKGPDCNYTLC